MANNSFQYHPFIRLLYGLMVVAMFAFFIMLVKQYGSLHVQANEAVGRDQIADSASFELDPKASSVELNASKLVYWQAFAVQGITYKIDLNEAVEHQVDQAWQDFAMQHLKSSALTRLLNQQSEPGVVYQTYQNYSLAQNSVDVIIGYRSSEPDTYKDSLDTHFISQGQYWPEREVLSAWSQSQTLPVDLSFDGDFERFEMDDAFNISKQMAYLNIKQEAH